MYEQNHQKYATEDAVRSMFLSKNASDPRCAATVMTEEAWEEVGGLGVGDDGSVINESKRYKFVKNSYYEGTKACSELVFWEHAYRSRTAKCMNHPTMMWDENLGMCALIQQDDPTWQCCWRTGLLLAAAGVQFEDGTSLTYAHDSRGRLLSITHSTGRCVDVQYLAPGDDSLISALVIAGQPVVSYAYSPAGELISATYADGASRTYHYEDARFPGYLTGITAEGNQRYSWYGYDAKGRVTCSRHSGDCSQADVGIDGVRLEYTLAGTTIVTDALGKQSTYALTASGASGLPRKVNGVTESNGSISRTYLPEGTDSGAGCSR